jgi:hypothetical protein
MTGHCSNSAAADSSQTCAHNDCFNSHDAIVRSDEIPLCYAHRNTFAQSDATASETTVAVGKAAMSSSLVSPNSDVSAGNVNDKEREIANACVCMWQSRGWFVLTTQRDGAVAAVQTRLVAPSADGVSTARAKSAHVTELHRAIESDHVPDAVLLD